MNTPYGQTPRANSPKTAELEPPKTAELEGPVERESGGGGGGGETSRRQVLLEFKDGTQICFSNRVKDGSYPFSIGRHDGNGDGGPGNTDDHKITDPTVSKFISACHCVLDVGPGEPFALVNAYLQLLLTLLRFAFFSYAHTDTARKCNSRRNLDRYEPARRVGQRGEDPTRVDTRKDAAYSDSRSSRRSKIVLQRKEASFNTAVGSLHLPRFSRLKTAPRKIVLFGSHPSSCYLRP